MDIEFHYYITYFVAIKSGFNPDDAYVIAYSSQYTDDNNYIYEISPESPDAYKNYISQTLNILKPKNELLRIHPIFHFMPGSIEEIQSDSTWRRDGKLHIMNSTPNNANASEILHSAFDSKNLYRIGIATHMYSDTFAHQNFVGYNDSFNSMKGLFEKAIPNIGHADAKHDPDWPALQWNDLRLISKYSTIDNKKRFLEAAEHLFSEYLKYNNTNIEEKQQERDNLIEELDKAIGKTDNTNSEREERMDRYRSILGEEFIEYNEDSWFKDAVKREAGFLKWDYSWKDDYQENHWFQFQEAVKEQQKVSIEVLRPTLEKMELKNF